MIRALLGRFFSHCIQQHRSRQVKVQFRRIDPKQMTDAEISDLVHGRRIDWTAVEARRAVAGSGMQ